MRFSSSNILGLAINERAIACVELSAKGSSATVRKAATFELAADQSLERPEFLGASLAGFLRAQGFGASRVVVGVPARWLIAVEKDVPPASEEQLAAMLRLQAERMGVGETGEMVFDFAGASAPSNGGKVLLVGMMRSRLENIRKTAESAELTLLAVTPMSLALAAAARTEAPMLHVGRNGAEMVWSEHSAPRMLRHVAVAVTNGRDAPAIGSLGLELRRAVATAPTNGTGGPTELMLFDSVGFTESQVAELSERIGLKLQPRELEQLGVRADSQVRDVERLTPAVALALVGARRQLLPLDFARSRLAPPPVRRFGRRSVWAGAIAALLVLGISGLWINVTLLQRQLGSIAQEKKEIADPLSLAQAVKDGVDYSNGFFKTRTPMLECLRQITENFRDDEPIWATTFNIAEDRDSKAMGSAIGRLEGKTTDMAVALALADRMRQNPSFTRVSVRDLSEAGGRQRDQSSFSITFYYSGGK